MFELVSMSTSLPTTHPFAAQVIRNLLRDPVQRSCEMLAKTQALVPYFQCLMWRWTPTGSGLWFAPPGASAGVTRPSASSPAHSWAARQRSRSAAASRSTSVALTRERLPSSAPNAPRSSSVQRTCAATSRTLTPRRDKSATSALTARASTRPTSL